MCDLSDQNLRNFHEEMAKMRQKGKLPTLGLRPLRFDSNDFEKTFKINDAKKTRIKYRY